MFKHCRYIFLLALGITSLSVIFIISSSDAFSDMSSDKRFQYAMKTILRHEGGLSNDKNDPGGVTNYGISLRYLKSSHIDPNGDGKEDANDIIHLTLTEADSIYYRQWYEKFHYDKILNEDILTDLLDFSINAGQCQTSKIVKRAINDVTKDGVKVDCNLDQKTVEIINLIEPVVLHAAINKEEEDFYRDLVKRHPPLRCFLKGWLKRAAE